MLSAPLKITYSGDPKVIKNLLIKKELLEKNDPAHTALKTVLILPGGAEKGVIEGGVAVALEKQKLVASFDAILGMSTGAAVAWYMVGGEAAIGTTIYFDDNVKNHLFNFLRFWKILDIDTLEKVFKEKKSIDVEKIKSARSRLLISITDAKTGNGTFVDIKKEKDPLSYVIASMCIPILDGGKKVLINDKFYVDGALSMPWGINYAIEKLGATDILLVSNSPLMAKKPYSKTFYWIFRRFFASMVSKGVANQIETHVERYNKEQKYLLEPALVKNVRIGVIHPIHMPIHEWTMNRKLLQKGALTAMEFTNTLLGSDSSYSR